ncbi:MobF family relaxase [Leifsonia sp. TF02-11]|uniref:MobF family relaxase n=1 Tax=Leifsonia sp. TF02-11 TaxID=2815212 RepID=UPI001AA117BC|nr:MobF family relaxase [Leifsonia sp. TF02-11]MBO1741020.1 relaxase domain-containing protein [Leifsonia sp. TF02-11]
MMTVHVLHAGDGYTYLTRQVASHDQTRKRGEELTDYYTAEGNPAGVWFGKGAAALGMSGEVSEEQMKALFGEGLRPDADEFIKAKIAEGMSAKEAHAAARLGRRFMVPQTGTDEWAKMVGAAYREFRTAHGRVPEPGVERDLIRWDLATAHLQEQLGRAPKDNEVSRFLATIGKQDRQPVAGYDLVFTPSKSFSVLWILADKERSQQLHEIHNDAVRMTLSWIEQEAGKTRVGAGGIAQMDTHGLTVTMFEHFDSRSGDPNLHTHAAVSTKVQGIDGKWRSLDGRILHNLGVAASERYNMLVQVLSMQRLGLAWTDTSRGRDKRPVPEIAGVDQDLCRARSSRRVAIEDEYAKLVKEYVTTHGHTPPRKAQQAMLEKANLATREAKDQLRSLDEIRDTEAEFAEQYLGAGGTQTMLDAAFSATDIGERARILEPMNLDQVAEYVLRNVENSRTTWRIDHLEAEANRAVAAYFTTHPDLDPLTFRDALLQRTVDLSVRLTADEPNPVPAALQLANGSSIYRLYRGETYTSQRILDTEERLVQAAPTTAGFRVPEDVFDATLAQVNAAQIAAGKYALDPTQAALARHFACNGGLIDIGIGPAGTGKTTSMRAFARAVEAAGGRVLAVAPSAAASTVLAEEIDVEADTADKLIQIHTTGTPEQRASDRYRIDANTVLLIDEAGMASLPMYAKLLELAEAHGASIKALGDYQQLAAVEAGGTLRLLDKTVGAVALEHVYRFVDQEEAAATLRLRDGKETALDFYVTRGRTHGGLRMTLLEDIYDAFLRDEADGKEALMLAATNEEVVALSARARIDKIAAGTVSPEGPTLHDGNRAGVGDRIVTRDNNRRLRANQGKDFVANGDLWHVLEVGDDGSLKVKSIRHEGVVTLPAWYVAEHVELGYATTVNRSQGMTVDTTHTMIDPDGTAREQLYVAATRGRQGNHLYVITDDTLAADGHSPDRDKDSILHGLERVLAREQAELSATETLEQEQEAANSLQRLVPAYEDANVRVLGEVTKMKMEIILRSVLDRDAAGRITDDPAWAALAERLAAHEARGSDVRTVLRNATASRDIDGFNEARSLAKVLHYRVGDPAGVPTIELPSWITPAPGSVGHDPTVRDWVNQQADLIANRINALTDLTEATRPVWMESLGSAPEDSTQRALWRRNLARIIAYRDYHHITADTPLGPPPAHDDPAYADALAALRELRAPAATNGRPTAESSPADRVDVAERVDNVTAAQTSRRPLDVDEEPHRSLSGPEL